MTSWVALRERAWWVRHAQRMDSVRPSSFSTRTQVAGGMEAIEEVGGAPWGAQRGFEGSAALGEPGEYGAAAILVVVADEGEAHAGVVGDPHEGVEGVGVEGLGVVDEDDAGARQERTVPGELGEERVDGVGVLVRCVAVDAQRSAIGAAADDVAAGAGERTDGGAEWRRGDADRLRAKRR